MTIRFAAPASLAVALALCCPPAGSAAALPSAAAPSAAVPSAAAPSTAAPSTAGVSREDMEPRVDPCVDFYRYACGGWMANHPVPPDQRAWSRFAALTDANRAKLRDILSADATPADPAGGDADQRKLGDFYGSCMDEAGVEKRGVAAIQPELERIAALRSAAELPALLARLHRAGVSALFRFNSAQDSKDATSVIAVVDAGGLALPDRDYYLKTDAKSTQQRAEYREHLQRMFGLLGEAPASAAAGAAAVLEVETSLAKASLDRVTRRDPQKVYHKLRRAELAALTPSFEARAGWPIAHLDLRP
ncbi:MAG TPA: M13 family metallopeptidase N-terminal domain-containing protein, partial [Thermoanaerobaculia bacterium]